MNYKKRTFSVTWLTIWVLLFLISQTYRFFYTLSQWEFLSNFENLNLPVYLVLSSFAWVTILSYIIYSLKNSAPNTLKTVKILLTIFYGHFLIDQTFVVQNTLSKGNLYFIFVTTIIIAAHIFYLLQKIDLTKISEN